MKWVSFDLLYNEVRTFERHLVVDCIFFCHSWFKKRIQCGHKILSFNSSFLSLKWTCQKIECGVSSWAPHLWSSEDDVRSGSSLHTLQVRQPSAFCRGNWDVIALDRGPNQPADLWPWLTAGRACGVEGVAICVPRCVQACLLLLLPAPFYPLSAFWGGGLRRAAAGTFTEWWVANLKRLSLLQNVWTFPLKGIF